MLNSEMSSRQPSADHRALTAAAVGLPEPAVQWCIPPGCGPVPGFAPGWPMPCGQPAIPG